MAYPTQEKTSNSIVFLCSRARLWLSGLIANWDRLLRQFHHRLKPILACTLLLFSIPVCKAQSGGATGTIVGTVVDASGALVVGAKVTITEAATNAVQATTTSGSGTFALTSLKPGVYNVTATAPGFETSSVLNVNLVVGSQQRVDLKLVPGATNQSVTVSDSSIGLDTENAAVGQTVTNQEIVDLPLNGRNFTELLTLNSGASAVGGEQGQYRANEGGALTIQGARPSSNQFFLDGQNINDTYYQVPAVIPSIDILQEFQEQTKGYSAAYGGGANQINLSTKSGTNQIHGSAYDFLRNDALDAKGYFAPGKKPPLRQNQFGYYLGGPIVIPHIYNGHNKSFFLANYEGLRANTSSIVFANVPTVQQKQGVFSNTIVDPLTKVPYANNTIAPSQFSQFAQASLSEFPDPNISSPQGNYTTLLTLPTNSDQQTYRFDQTIQSRDAFFVRYTRTNYSVTSQGNSSPFASGEGHFPETSSGVAASWTHTFSPRLLNQARFGYLTEGANLTGIPTTTAIWDSLGLKNIYPYDPSIPLPSISFRNGQYTPAGGTTVIQEYSQQTNSISDALTWNVGAHTVGIGIDARWWHTYQNNPGPPQLTYDGSGTAVAAADGGTVAGTGDPFADFLAGYVAQAVALAATPYSPTVATSNVVAYNFRYFAPWIQDDWKASRKLTINAGIRWDYNKKPFEDENRVFWIDPNIAGGGLYAASKQIIDAGLGGDLYVWGGRRFPGPPQYGTFAPRFGFAYRPGNDDKTVVRAGYGIFYDTAETKEAYDGGGYPWGTQQSLQFINSADLFPTPPPFGPVTSSALGFLFIQTANVHTPYMQDWQLSVERALGGSWKGEVDYLGSKGTHLLGRIWENAPTQYDPANPTPVSARIPYPNIGLILDHVYGFHSSYNALQAKLERSGSNYSAIISYTYAHSLDDKSGTTGVNGDTSGNGPMNEYDWNEDYSSSSFDVTHNFVGSVVAAVPVGRGRRFLGNSPRPLDLLVGGWQGNAIVSLRTGFPFSIAATDVGFLNENFGQRADVVGKWFPSGLKKGVNQWFDPSAFAQPVIGAYGDSARNLVRAPGVENVDASVFKNISLYERLTLQTRFEAFNLFNHTNLGGPDNSLSSPTFGAISSTAPGRILQVAAKLIW
jgi:hypothetical protein